MAAARAILGYEVHEITELWTGPDWETYDERGAPLPPSERPIAVSLATGRTVTGRIVGWRRSDGSRILLRVSCIPDVVGTGRMLVTFTDTTEERRVERILDATFEAAPAGLALIDSSGSIVRCNDRFGHQAQLAPEELVGVDVLSLVHPDDREASGDVAARLRAGDGGEVEHRVARPDDDERWVETHLGLIDDPDRPLAITASFDVTTERRLIAELTRYGHLFRQANDVIVIIDPQQGSVLLASSSSRTILGDPGEQGQGRNIFDRIRIDASRCLSSVAPTHVRAITDASCVQEVMGWGHQLLPGDVRCSSAATTMRRRLSPCLGPTSRCASSSRPGPPRPSSWTIRHGEPFCGAISTPSRRRFSTN